MRSWWVLLVIGTSLTASAENVLSRKAPRLIGLAGPTGMVGIERLTDGDDALEGDPWNGAKATVINFGVTLDFDLGAPMPLVGAALQGDNNDEYVLSLSEDGVNWNERWRAPPVEGSGLRTRSVEGPLGVARFVRIAGRGGDSRFSLSEIEVFAGNTDGSVLLRNKWFPRRPLEQSFLWWALGMAALLVVSSGRLPRARLAVLAAVGLGWTGWLVFELTPHADGALASLPLARAAVALVAIAAVVRDRLWRGVWPASTPFIVGTLGLTAAMGVWCFLNLGVPQFHDAGQRRGTWLHHYDMRTYYPIAKYFPELRFDGVYAASLLAVAEGQPLENFDSVMLRDLRTHDLTSVRDAKPHLLAVRARFSPERWAEFLTDMQYFRRAMSDGGFLGSMNDHGGNATPVWFLTARALFAGTPASDATLWRGVWADIFLLALAIAALWWAFGARTALLGLTIFGAMDFYQFGSNWFGATLRHDWLSLWAIGLALLQKRKFALAGAALAWSAWIRAFPALTLFTFSIPFVWLGGRLVLLGRFSELKTKLAPLWKVIFGVVVASVVLVGLSTLVFGADSWTEWLRKVRILDRDNHLNNIAFRTYISVEKSHYWAAVVGSLTLLFFTLRNASASRAAAWGVALIGIIFNPANYYLHSAFLFVVLAAERHVSHGATVRPRGVLVWVTLLLMCIASYFSNVNVDTGQHFRLETIILFVTLGVLWLLELGRPREALG